MQREFFFTFTSNLEVGFTDNLHYLLTLYKLAHSIGGIYVHTPPGSDLSPDGVFAFLGFNDRWERRAGEKPFSGMPRLEVGFDERHVRRSSFAKLQVFLADSVDTNVVPRAGKVLVVLSLKGAAGYLRHVHAAIPDRPVELLDSYRRARETDPVRSPFADGGLRILYHIRQGDTAVVETPWKSFFPLWHVEGDRRIEEVHSREELSGRYTYPERFLSFARVLCGELEEGSFSNVVASDGYARAFRMIFEHRVCSRNPFARKGWFRRGGKSRTIQLSRRRERLLRECERGYEERVFKPFESLPSTSLLVGEEGEKLFVLLEAVLKAHIIVIGTQQRMILKFLAAYHDITELKLVVVLEESEKEMDYHGQMGLPRTAIRILQLNSNGRERERMREALEDIGAEAGWPVRFS